MSDSLARATAVWRPPNEARAWHEENVLQQVNNSKKPYWSWLRRFYRGRLRARIRGYALLRSTNQIGVVRSIKTTFSDACLSQFEGRTSGLIFGAALPIADRVVRQYLLQRYGGVSLSNALLLSLGRKSAPVVCPLPQAWGEIVVRHGFVADLRLSALAWGWEVFLLWGWGVYTIFRLVASSLSHNLSGSLTSGLRYAYFDGLSKRNLPQKRVGTSFDILTWYSIWEGRADRVEALCHGVKDANSSANKKFCVDYCPQPFERLREARRFWSFLAWGLVAAFLAAFDALRGRWWHSLMLAEAAKARAVRLCDKSELAADYLFHYSGSSYRPLWTYEAEKKGSRILCYFYSTSEQAKLPKGYESQRYEWGAASWSNYLVWDSFQAEAIRRDINYGATIQVVGPIWFLPSETSLPLLPGKSIAVFDFAVPRVSSHFAFSTMGDYIAANPGLIQQFLEHIHTVLSECGATMAFKSKWTTGNRITKKHRDIVQQLSQSKDVVMVDPSFSPIDVIEQCRGVISIPFTSTAHYLKDRGIPSAYYDPSGWIQKDDRGAHGITILSGIEELRIWVKAVFEVA